MEKEKVLENILTLSGKMLMDKQCIETYAKTLGYDISVESHFQSTFERRLMEMYPITGYMYHEAHTDKTVNLNNPSVSKKMLFAICNSELYMVNRFYHLIEKVDIKNRTVKMLSCANILHDTMKLFNINFSELKAQANGKTIFYFDELNFDKIKSVLMHSNEYTEIVLKCIDNECRVKYAKGESIPDILNVFYSNEGLTDVYPYINKYLLKYSLENK